MVAKLHDTHDRSWVRRLRETSEGRGSVAMVVGVVPAIAGAAVLLTGCASTEPKRAVVPTAAATAAADAVQETTATDSSAVSETIPDVVGMDRTDAIDELDAAGFEATETAQPTTEESEDGVVIDQSPEGGSEGEVGRQVVISLGEFEEPETISVDAARFGFQSTMEGDDVRDQVIDSVERIVESLDKYAIEGDGETLVISTTSGYATEEFVAEDGWEIARDLGFFWSDEFWDEVEKGDEWWPSLHLTVNELVWECPGEAMRQLASREVSRSDWSTACGR